jgi:outer membrane protein insertion porin family
MRFGFFYDIGNIFTTANVDFFYKLCDPINHDIDYNNLKQSFGFAAEWLAPMGLLKFSFGKLLNAQSEDDRFYGDRTEEFQFTMGNAF